MIRKNAATDDSSESTPTRHRAVGVWRYPIGTGVGAAVGASLVVAAAGVVGVGAVGFATSIAVGVVLGGWAGRRFSGHQLRQGHPREAMRRRRRGRILRITRTLHRRRVLRASTVARPRAFPRLHTEQVRLKFHQENIDATR